MSDRRDQLHEEPRDRADERDDVQTPHDALGAYALGALSIDEQRLFELHLFVCAACRADLTAHRHTAELLPYGLPSERPPADARDRLLARARAKASESPTVSVPLAGVPLTGDDERPTVAVPVVVADESPPVLQTAPVQEGADDGPPTVPVRRVQPPQGVRIRPSSIGWAAVLLSVLASGLFVIVWSATGPHASLDMQVLARMPGGQVLALRGTGAPTASAHLFVVDSGRRAELAVDALPPLPPGRVYQLWFTEPGQPDRTSGAFSVNPQGDAVVRVTIPTPLERVRAVSVTQEPTPGLASPTGAHLLDWTP